MLLFPVLFQINKMKNITTVTNVRQVDIPQMLSIQVSLVAVHMTVRYGLVTPVLRAAASLFLTLALILLSVKWG